jgi:hypothetical protein
MAEIVIRQNDMMQGCPDWWHKFCEWTRTECVTADDLNQYLVDYDAVWLNYSNLLDNKLIFYTDEGYSLFMLKWA